MYSCAWKLIGFEWAHTQCFLITMWCNNFVLRHGRPLRHPPEIREIDVHLFAPPWLVKIWDPTAQPPQPSCFGWVPRWRTGCLCSFENQIDQNWVRKGQQWQQLYKILQGHSWSLTASISLGMSGIIWMLRRKMEAQDFKNWLDGKICSNSGGCHTSWKTRGWLPHPQICHCKDVLF